MNMKEAKKLINDRIKIAKEHGGLVHLSIEDAQKIITLLEASGAIVEKVESGEITGRVYEPCLFGTIELQRLLIGMAYTPC